MARRALENAGLLSRYEYQMSGWVSRGVWTRPGVTVGSIVSPVFQRDSLSGPLTGLSHSNASGLAGSSGVDRLKSHS